MSIDSHRGGRLRKRALLLAALSCSPLAMAQVPVTTALMSFTAEDGAENPVGTVVEGDDGRLYGAARRYGGESGLDARSATWSVNRDGSGFAAREAGSLFRSVGLMGPLLKTPNGRIYGIVSVQFGYDVVRFSPTLEDPTPVAQLYRAPGYFAVDTAGNLYVMDHADGNGTTGAGAIWKMSGDESAFTLIHLFDPATEGQKPAALISGADGRLYGVLARCEVDCGRIYRMQADGSAYTLLHDLSAGEGRPEGSTTPNVRQGGIVEADGWLYGTMRKGGANDGGTVFRLRLDGSGFRVLHHFDSVYQTEGTLTGHTPGSSLIRGPDGNVYGNAGGGQARKGVLYRIVTASADNPDGGFEVVHTFSGSDGEGPGGLTLASDGKIYGIAANGGTANNGTLFVIDTGYVPAGPLPAITSFIATPTSLTLGAQSVLSWTVTDADTCTAAGGWSGDKPTSGESAVTPTAAGDVTYTLTCIGMGGEATRSLTITVTGPAPPGNGGGNSDGGSSSGGGGALSPAMVAALLLALLGAAGRRAVRDARLTFPRRR